LKAIEELKVAENAVLEFLSYPIPQPKMPLAWHENEDGTLHTPVGGSDAAHREACQRQKLLATSALQAVGALVQWRDLMLPLRNGERETANSESGAKKKRGSAKGSQATKAKLPGDADVKLVAALTEHHNYGGEGSLNQDPIGSNKLAEKVTVANSTSSAFFKKRFRGHENYKRICRTADTLAYALRMLNGECSPHLLLTTLKPEEVEQEEDE